MPADISPRFDTPCFIADVADVTLRQRRQLYAAFDAAAVMITPLSSPADAAALRCYDATPLLPILKSALYAAAADDDAAQDAMLIISPRSATAAA